MNNNKNTSELFVGKNRWVLIGIFGISLILILGIVDWFSEKRNDFLKQEDLIFNDSSGTKYLYNFEIPSQYDRPLVIAASDNIFSIKPLNAFASLMISDGDVIKYQEAYKNTDIVQATHSNKLKENIILKQPGHPEAFEYQINVVSYDFQKDTNGNIVFYQKGKKGNDLYKIFSILAPFMIDANSNKSSVLDVETLLTEQGILTVRPTKEWLQKAAYPVVLDPTIEINIINVHSYPQEGTNWEVEFTTLGQADLKIIPHDQSTIDDDEFISLGCGGKNRQPKILPDDVIYYPNWQCDGIGKVVHYTKKAGKHTLRFEFGEEVAYAYNNSSVFQVFTSSATWTAPVGVTSIDVECWGGGGAGKGTAVSAGGGGGGGAYSKKSGISVTPGNNYSVIVGAGGTGGSGNGGNGGDSYFSDGSQILAKGGTGATTTTGAPGGQASSGVGDVKYSGGTGGAGSAGDFTGGGGGGSAGSTNNGGTGGNGGAIAGGSGGSGSMSGGGGGGAGGATMSAGVAGNLYGGGGGGGGAANGGSGAQGICIIYYNVITFVGVGAQVATSVDSQILTPSLPTGWQADDLFILVIAGRPESTTPTELSVSAGWIQQGSSVYYEVGTVDLGVLIYYRVAQAGDTAPTVTTNTTWTSASPGSTAGVSAQIFAYRGVATSTPFDVDNATGTSAAAQTWTPPAVTTNTDYSRVISIVATADDNALHLSTTNGFLADAGGINYDTAIGTDHAVGVAQFIKATAGLVTMDTWKEVLNSTDAWVGITTALKPSGAAAPSPTYSEIILMPGVIFNQDVIFK